MAKDNVVSFGWNQTKSEATAKSKVSGRIYFTKETDGSTAIYVDGERYALGSEILDTIITWYNSTIGVGDTTGVIDQWDEIVKFLEGMSDSDAETLANKLAAINTEITKIKNGTTTVGKATNANHANSADNATNATNAGRAEQATTAETALKATQDGAGNIIVNTYAKKSELADGTITVKNATNATNATTATNLASKPAIAKGTTSTNAITVTAGGKTSDEFTVPYATNAGGASSSQTARELETAPSLIADGDAIKVKAGGKTSTAFTVPFATKATTLTGKPIVTQADQNKNVTITVGGQTSESFTIGYATTAGSATTANSATKATQDGAGNNIVNTYATKANLGTLSEGYDALMEALTWQ